MFVDMFKTILLVKQSHGDFARRFDMFITYFVQVGCPHFVSKQAPNVYSI